ncbi:MAG TPA: phenylacetaldoxime dehydratase family protein [bacterium]|nr:phenylacetaldoxime dehydratase family protein [bacterium]
MSDQPIDSAYIGALWEHPTLCVALFGVQFLTEEGQRLYEEAGIDQDMLATLEEARAAGLLLHRLLMSPEGPVLMQYWRSYEDLDRWARKQPHSRWWRWLLEHTGKGVGFYHEIYQAKTAEAIYEQGTRPVGPAFFSSIRRVKGGEGHSRERQRQFTETTERPT